MSRPGPADLGAALIASISLGAHALFAIQDGRLPTDLGLVHKDLPTLWAALGELPGSVGAVLSGATQAGGWQDLLLAVGLRVFGRQAGVLHAYDIVAFAGVLLATWVLSRRLGGPRAGLSAVALVAATPAVVVQARQDWIHVPEAALVLGALAALTADPTLSRRRTVALAALLGGLAIALRPSGLVWVAPLVLLLAFPPRPRRLHAGIVGGLWLLALSAPARHLNQYLSAKLGARARYEADLPALLPQLHENLGSIVMLAILIGGIGLARRRPRRDLGTYVVLLTWAGLALLMWAVFRAGLDNFTAAAPALAVLAAVGLTRLSPASWPLPVVAWLLFAVPALLPSEIATPLARLPGVPPQAAAPHIRNRLRPWSGWGVEDLGALLDATCPQRPRCTVAVDQGVFAPFSEDEGQLELFLAGEQRLSMWSLRQHQSLPEQLRVDALVVWDCGKLGEDGWRHRYPQTADELFELIDGLDLRAVWTREVGEDCTVAWLTPMGGLEAPSALPQDGVTIKDPVPPPRLDRGLDEQPPPPPGPAPVDKPALGMDGRPLGEPVPDRPTGPLGGEPGKLPEVRKPPLDADGNPLGEPVGAPAGPATGEPMPHEGSR